MPATPSASLNERWEWLTEGRLHQIVVEEYHPGSRAVFAEFWIGDEGIELGGQGELVAEPVADHSFLPAPDLTPEQERALMGGGRRLSEVLREMGYRGVLSADAIVVDIGDGDPEFLFTEYNGVVTGSTRVHHLGKRLAGADYAHDRLPAEYVSWPMPSFAEAASTWRARASPTTGRPAPASSPAELLAGQERRHRRLLPGRGGHRSGGAPGGTAHAADPEALSRGP